jgi:two-component system chemotaxis response regulator CheV
MRLELLLFRLDDSQVFGINVFKVQEVIGYRPLTRLPGAHPLIRGIAHLRGRTMSVMDLASAVGKPPLAEPEKGHIVITEYNRSVHGFLVKSVDRIVNTQWKQVLPPPSAAGPNSYVTAVTLIEDRMVEILDVEKVLDQVVHADTRVSDDVAARADGVTRRVLVVDDSSVARHQVERSLAQIGVECIQARDGREAIELLQALAADGIAPREHFAMVISDVEMPEVDGYQLTVAIRHMPGAEGLYILLHSSINGEFNLDMIRKTGADRFVQKYCPDDLARAVLDRVGPDTA